MKRIVFAIGLLPFGACVVDSSDDDDNSTNADTENVSNTNPSTTNPSSSSTTDDTDTATTEPDTSSGSESGSSESGEPTGLGTCDTVCRTYTDCCEAAGVSEEMCMDGGLGGYACEDTECFVLGCADDMECQDLYMNDAWACNPDTDGCWIPCDTVDDCEMAFPGVYDLCDPDIGCTIETEPFDCNETPCNAPFVCDEDSGACVECLADGDCAESDYGPYCDTELNLCACMTTDDCAFALDECEF